MKNYLDEIYTVSRFMLDHPELAEKAERARRSLRNVFPTDDEDEFVIIKVEGYYCVAYLMDEFAPYELARTIQPFDENRLYPLQGLVTEYAFEKYYK